MEFTNVYLHLLPLSPTPHLCNADFLVSPAKSFMGYIKQWIRKMMWFESQPQTSLDEAWSCLSPSVEAPDARPIIYPSIICSTEEDSYLALLRQSSVLLSLCVLGLQVRQDSGPVSAWNMLNALTPDISLLAAKNVSPPLHTQTRKHTLLLIWNPDSVAGPRLWSNCSLQGLCFLILMITSFSTLAIEDLNRKCYRPSVVCIQAFNDMDV